MDIKINYVVQGHSFLMHQSKVTPYKVKVVSYQTNQGTKKNMGLWRAKVPFQSHRQLGSYHI